MATRATLRARVQQHLQDPTALVWATTLLDAWMDEGLRRCPPVLLDEKVATVACVATGKSVASPTGCLQPVRVYDAALTAEVPAWRYWGSSISFEAAVGFTGNLSVEYLGVFDDWTAGDAVECPLATHQEDVVVFFAVGRAFRELARGRVDYKKYSTVVDNGVGIDDIERLADFWEGQFEKARLEARTVRQLFYEQTRLGGADGSQ